LSAKNLILDVVGAKEAHEILRVELQRISRWRKAGKLPLPYADLALSPVWVRADIEQLMTHDAVELGPALTVFAFTPPPDPPPLLGTAEVAAFLSIDKSQIARWRSGKTARVEFPKPDAQIAAGPLWSRPTIERFAATRHKAMLWTAGQAARKLRVKPDELPGVLVPAGKVKSGLLYRPEAVLELAALAS
jgi:hypothetical protein